MQRLAHQTELELLEVAQAAMEHLGASARWHWRRSAGTHHTAADHHDVELLGAQSLPGLRALVGSEEGLTVTRPQDRVAHCHS